MAQYFIESMPDYQDALSEFERLNHRPPNDLDKMTLQGEVTLRLLIRIDERLTRVEEHLMPQYPER